MGNENGKRRLPVRHETIELDGAWEGWSFGARVSLPMQRYGELMDLIDEFQNLDDAKPGQLSASLRNMVAALRQAVSSWNFVDEEGEPIAHDQDESWALLPFELISLMFRRWMGTMNQAPLASGAGSPPTSSETMKEPSPTTS